MTKEERLKEIEVNYQAKLNHMIDNNLVDDDVIFGLAYLLVVAIDSLKAVDGRCKDYQRHEGLIIDNLEKTFDDVEKEALKMG